MFWNKKPEEKQNSQEYTKLYNLYVEISGQYHMLKANLEALTLELEGLKAKYKYLKYNKAPEQPHEEGIPSTPKSLNTFSPFT